MPSPDLRASQTFRGLVPLRIGFAAMGLFVLVFSVSLGWTAPRGEASAMKELGGLALLILFSAAAAYGSMAMALEAVVVDDAGVHRHNPVWFDRSLGWDQIAAVSLATDGYNTHPLLQTSDGRKVRLRGASSLWRSPRTTAARATQAIDARLGSP